MKTHIIRQKMSGTGSIHDIASQHYDRYIDFPRGSKYAVVLADYYGGKGYTTHRTSESAIKSSRKNKNYSHVIIDPDGCYYYADGDNGYLEKIDF